MQVSKIKPAATIAVQFPAGVEISAIQHEGNLYLPVMPLGAFAAVEDAPERPTKKVVEDRVKDSEPETSRKSKIFTEEEMMEMPTKELEKICLGMGIDPDKTKGKNTNKKLRELILDAQEGGEVEEENPKSKSTSKEVEEDEEPTDGGSLEDTVAEILEDFDAGTINKKKAIAKLLENATEEADTKKVTELVATFEDDAEADLEETAKEIAKALLGEEKPKKEKGKAKTKKEVLVEPEDLEVGQKVSVYWEDQEDWFNGEVKSIKKGKILIAYEDDTEEILDSENNTKIKAL